MDRQIQDLLDRQAILDCVHRYTRGVDRHDAELMASAFHPDAIDDHGHFCGAPADLAEYLNGMHTELFSDHLHFVTNHLAEITGDSAHAETYYLMIGRHRNGGQAGIWSGRYIDRFERREGRWAIAVRVIVPAVSQDTLAGKNAGAAQGTFPGSQWDRSDKSYDRPLSA